MTRRRRRTHPKTQIRTKKPKSNRTHRRRRRAVRRRPAVVRQALAARGEDAPLPSTPAAPRDARIRLDPDERELLIAALTATLPKAVRKKMEGAYWSIDWKLRERYKVQHGLILRLRAPRRGHPSTW